MIGENGGIGMEVSGLLLIEVVKIYKVLSNVNWIKILIFLEYYEVDVM